MIVGLAFTFWSMKTQAQENNRKVEQFEKTFEQVASIARDLKDPNNWLRQYLINHNIDSTTAKNWCIIPKGAPLKANGDTLTSIPFLDKKYLPEMGLYKMVKGDKTIKILDTLWEFKK